MQIGMQGKEDIIMKKRILFTGGSGKAGRHVVAWLVDAGYDVHNIDWSPLDNPV